MSFAVKEMFYSLQGEGRHAGRPAVFCRFAGCNLWSGRESDRETAACNFCDTDFVGVDGEGGGRRTAGPGGCRGTDVERHRWPAFRRPDGGEPLLQVDDGLIAALHQRGSEIAIETNGTLPVSSPIDWITVSPKGTTELVQTSGDELKLVYPQANVDPASFEGLAFSHFLLQPKDGPERDANMADAIAYCLQHPRWKLSLQTHKYMSIR